MGETDEGAALPDFVTWPSFPFEGDLRLRTLPERAYEPKRAGDPDGPPCRCPEPDSNFIWADAHWRVRAAEPKSVPLVFLETREHLDLDELPEALLMELGPMIRRVERAIRSTGSISHVHVHRWGDGSAHFHMWFFGRPHGASHLLGMGMSMWAEISSSDDTRGMGRMFGCDRTRPRYRRRTSRSLTGPPSTSASSNVQARNRRLRAGDHSGVRRTSPGTRRPALVARGSMPTLRSRSTCPRRRLIATPLRQTSPSYSSTGSSGPITYASSSSPSGAMYPGTKP